ncbi:MAG: arylsulfatase [Ferruginibacter sp.]
MKQLLQFILIVFAICAVCSADAQHKKTNIIFILADDLGYADLGCYGQQKIKTPHIDALAKMGMSFKQFYSGSTVCAPARTTFMTGLHTGHTAIRGNKTLEPEGQFPLPDSIVTFPMLLQKSGYYTAAFGKWSLGFITSSGDPQKKGYNDFFGYNCQTLAHDYYPDHLWDDHQRINYPDNPTKFTDYSADIIHARAMETIRKQDNSHPFFLYLPYTIPHADLTVPHDDVYSGYVKLFNEKPLTISNKKDTAGKPFEPFPHAAFAAMVSRLDKYVGEIVDLVHQKNLEENTLIIFTSDNGPHREGGGDPTFFNNTAGLRGIKRDLYEGGIREPLIVYWKNHTKPGAVSNEPFALWDFYPTFLSLADVKTTQPADGISLLPVFTGKPQQQHDYFYWELQEAGGKQAVRWGKWKAVKLDVTLKADPSMELYDLDADPFEKNNIAAQHPDIVKQIDQYMKAAHRSNKDWPLLLSEQPK